MTNTQVFPFNAKQGTRITLYASSFNRIKEVKTITFHFFIIEVLSKNLNSFRLCQSSFHQTTAILILNIASLSKTYGLVKWILLCSY
jgi:hypothetical protein